MASADRANAVSELFDAKAAEWAAKYQPGGRLPGRLAELMGAIGTWAAPSGSLLDLGCGTGELARAAAAAGLRVSACDISAEMIKRAVASDSAGEVRWIRLDPDWSVLPFPASSFDAVVAASVLEYVDDPDAIFAECRRVLRPGGVFLCTVPDLRHPVRWLEWAVKLPDGLPILVRIDDRWPRLASYRAYLRLSAQRHLASWWLAQASRAGLRGVEVTGTGSPLLPLRLMTLQRPSTGPASIAGGSV